MKALWLGLLALTTAVDSLTTRHHSSTTILAPETTDTTNTALVAVEESVSAQKGYRPYLSKDQSICGSAYITVTWEYGAHECQNRCNSNPDCECANYPTYAHNGQGLCYQKQGQYTFRQDSRWGEAWTAYVKQTRADVPIPGPQGDPTPYPSPWELYVMARDRISHVACQVKTSLGNNWMTGKRGSGCKADEDDEDGRDMGKRMVKAYSAGYLVGNTAAVYVNDQQVSSDSRGINVVTIDPQSRDVKARAFDTYAYAAMAEELEAYVDGLSRTKGLVLILSCKDECTARQTSRMQQALKKIGSKLWSHVGFRESWLFVTVLGETCSPKLKGKFPFEAKGYHKLYFEQEFDFLDCDAELKEKRRLEDVAKAKALRDKLPQIESPGPIYNM